MNKSDFLNDIGADAARQAYGGVSHWPERRAESTRSEYAEKLAADYADLAEQAAKGGTVDLLEAEFARYRDGYRKRNLAYLHSSSRCVSWFIAGPSNFPASRMNKRAEISHKRLTELLDFRARAKAEIVRKLRPDLAPIYASDSNALERLQADISKLEAKQERMKRANAVIRKHLKGDSQAKTQALLEEGFSLSMAQQLLTKNCFGGIGYESFQLTNNGANIRRMKARFEQITRLRATPGSEAQGSNARLEDAPQDNRVRLWFAGKPAESVRDDLKSCGFRWTPSLGCWQAYRNYSAMNAAQRIAGIHLQAA